MLTRLRLRNVFQHQDLDWTFGPGLTGIFGSNGSGKTNALIAACGSLTNRFPSQFGDRQQLIYRGASAEEPSWIETHWTVRGVAIEIFRDLRTGERYLRCPDGELRDERSIQEKVQQVFGLTSRLITKLVFVGQWEMFSVLTCSDAERDQLYQELYDLRLYEKIWEELGVARREVESMLRGPAEEEVLQAERAFQEAREEYARRVDRLRSAKSYGEKETRTLGAAREILEKFARYQQLQSQLEICSRQLQEATREVAVAQESYRTARSDLRECAMRLRRATQCKGPDALEAWLADQARERQLNEERRHVRAEISALGKRPDPPFSAREMEEAHARMEAVLKVRDEARRYLEAWQNHPDVCPLCSQPWPKGAVSENCELEWKRRADEAEREYHALQETVRESLLREQRLRAWCEVRSSCLARLHRLGPYREAASEEMCRDLRSLLESWKRALQEVRTRAAMLRQAKQRRRVQARMLWKLDSQLDALRVDPGEVERARATLERAASRATEMRHLYRACVDQRTLMRVHQRSVGELRRAYRRAARVRSWDELLALVRGIVQRDKLPLMMMRHRAAQLAQCMNRVLECFGSPFVVALDERMRLQVSTGEGWWESVHQKSGGEKVMLAVAFRWALHSLFSPNLDMLVLDEPTAGLDAENRKGLREALRHLDAVSRESGQQVILVTHDEDLRGILDSTLELR